MHRMRILGSLLFLFVASCVSCSRQERYDVIEHPSSASQTASSRKDEPNLEYGYFLRVNSALTWTGYLSEDHSAKEFRSFDELLRYPKHTAEVNTGLPLEDHASKDSVKLHDGFLCNLIDGVWMQSYLGSDYSELFIPPDIESIPFHKFAVSEDLFSAFYLEELVDQVNLWKFTAYHYARNSSQRKYEDVLEGHVMHFEDGNPLHESPAWPNRYDNLSPRDKIAQTNKYTIVFLPDLENLIIYNGGLYRRLSFDEVSEVILPGHKLINCTTTEYSIVLLFGNHNLSRMPIVLVNCNEELQFTNLEIAANADTYIPSVMIFENTFEFFDDRIFWISNGALHYIEMASTDFDH